MTEAQITAEIIRLTEYRKELIQEINRLEFRAALDMAEYHAINCDKWHYTAKKKRECYNSTKLPNKQYAESKQASAAEYRITLNEVNETLDTLRGALTTTNQSAAEIGRILAQGGQTVQGVEIIARGSADRQREIGKSEGLALLTTAELEAKVKETKSQDNRKKRIVLFIVLVVALIIAGVITYKKYA